MSDAPVSGRVRHKLRPTLAYLRCSWQVLVVSDLFLFVLFILSCAGAAPKKRRKTRAPSFARPPRGEGLLLLPAGLRAWGRLRLSPRRGRDHGAAASKGHEGQAQGEWDRRIEADRIFRPRIWINPQGIGPPPGQNQPVKLKPLGQTLTMESKPQGDSGESLFRF